MFEFRICSLSAMFAVHAILIKFKFGLASLQLQLHALAN